MHGQYIKKLICERESYMKTSVFVHLLFMHSISINIYHAKIFYKITYFYLFGVKLEKFYMLWKYRKSYFTWSQICIDLEIFFFVIYFEMFFFLANSNIEICNQLGGSNCTYFFYCFTTFCPSVSSALHRRHQITVEPGLAWMLHDWGVFLPFLCRCDANEKYQDSRLMVDY